MRVLRLKEVSSTNREAKRMGLDGAPGGTVVVAEKQTSGRGRLGRSWESPPGGLWMSLLIRPEEGDESIPAPAVSLAAGTAAAAALESIFISSGLDPGTIKLGWPNDIMVEDKKIAGILVESCTIDNDFGVIGIGININNSSTELPGELKGKATSVFDLSGKTIDIEIAMQRVLAELESKLAELNNGNLGNIIEAWKSKSAILGKQIRVMIPGEKPFEAKALDIEKDGKLLVELTDGERIALDYGETSLLR
ncbi:MAG TPA: biotin--[acetyl-CoA-carboxylase] ligase [bacterium]|nr:biotin--[acetyl-CoA-carboxylase] ligase [bacterium]